MFLIKLYHKWETKTRNNCKKGLSYDSNGKKPMSEKINPKELTPNTVVCITGEVVFSHISKHCTKQEAFDRAAKSQFRPDKPEDMKTYSYLQICNAAIVRQDSAAPLSKEEQYITNQMFTSKSNPGCNFTGVNSSKRLPKIYDKPAGDSKSAPLIQDVENGEPAKELAKGLPVLLVMKVFKGSGNNGIALEAVICREPAEFYKPNKVIDNAVSQTLGITLDDSQFQKNETLEEVNADDLGEMIDASIADAIASTDPAPEAATGTPFGNTQPAASTPTIDPGRLF